MNIDIKTLKQRLRTLRGTTRGRNLLTFLVFLGIATAFWFLTVLNEDEQRVYDVPVVFNNLPENVTLLNSEPLRVNVTVKDKGRSLVRFDWGRNPTINVDFLDYRGADNGRAVISREQALGLLHNIFGNTSEITSMRPDSVVVNYTTRPGERLPIVIDVDAQSAPQYIVHGTPVINTDSVTVFSPKGLPSQIISIRTEKISLRELSDSTTIDVPLEAPPGTLLVPSSVQITIPVQPLISKKRTVNVEPRNVPAGSKMLTFPPTVVISYMLPMNMYNDDNDPPKAIADYRDVNHSGSQPTVPITIGNIPTFYRGVSVEPQAVEFLIEH